MCVECDSTLKNSASFAKWRHTYWTFFHVKPKSRNIVLHTWQPTLEHTSKGERVGRHVAQKHRRRAKIVNLQDRRKLFPRLEKKKKVF